MPPAQLGRRKPGLLLFDHPDNLRFGETAFSRSSAPSQVEQTLHQTEGTSGGAGQPPTVKAIVKQNHYFAKTA